MRLHTVNQIIELLYDKNGFAELPDFNVSEIDYVIDFTLTALYKLTFLHYITLCTA